MAELLQEVKIRLSVTGTDLDGVLKGYIDDVLAFCESAGVPREKAMMEYGLVSRGVNDLWTNESHFSDIFMMRLLQVKKYVPEVTK